ncbi:MAG: tripartite tricarboxylate transporter substrate binding protein [Candidatus Protistobacter heckmanni]|nr:tripartite tricarboxylate transporter substrate binding protein [Candidatus Protistobacter heckmanni]
MKKKFAAALAVLASAFAVQSVQAADAWPSKPIRFVVPYLAGGTTDLVARTLDQKLSERLGQPVVIDNRGGAGGNIGMDNVAKSAPDGYTIGMGAISTNALNPHVYKSMPFDPRKDFTAISMLGVSAIVLEVGPNVPVKNVAELIQYAKAHPGMTYGTAGVGTSMHLSGVTFAQMTDINLIHVPYKGSVPGINDMLGGHLPMMFDNLPASVSFIRAGKLKALAVAGAKRSPALSNVPTMAEAGLKDYAIDPWFAVFGPAGMSKDVVQKLSREISAVLALPEVHKLLADAGFNAYGSTPEALDALQHSEYEKFRKIAQKTEISLD